MKTLHIILNSLVFTLFTHTACRKNLACESGNRQVVRQELSLPYFDRIEVNGSMYVYIREDSVQKVEVEIESNLVNDLNQRVSDGKWRIDFTKCVNEKKRVNVFVSIPHLKEVRLNGSGEVYSQTSLHGGDLVVDLNGSGKINLSTFYSHMIVSTNGSGNIELNGSSSSLKSSVSGSGEQHLLGLTSNEANVEINGSGEVELTVSKTLQAKISGNGTVRYKGSPAVSSSINGSGSVQHAN